MPKGRRLITIVGLIALGAVLATISICQPQILAGNTFLGSFVSHEIMAFLIVVLTITFASVANIHLQITNMVRSLSDPERQRNAESELAGPLRAEINSSAWLLFWAFIVCALALVVKGQFPENEQVVSLVHATAILVTVINTIVLYDIHQTIFALAPALTPGANDAKNPKPPPSLGQGET